MKLHHPSSLTIRTTGTECTSVSLNVIGGYPNVFGTCRSLSGSGPIRVALMRTQCQVPRSHGGQRLELE